jgi:type VI secretion system secreted protein Hcp
VGHRGIACKRASAANGNRARPYHDRISRKNQDFQKLGSKRAIRFRGTEVGPNRCKEIAMPIYMRITKNGVPVMTGDATAKGHEKWIELSSVQMGPQIRSTAPNSAAASATVSEIVITKPQDSTSMALWKQSLWGEGVTIQIDFVKSDRPYLTYTLQNALISGYTPGPMESLSLTFTKMTFDTHGTGPDVSGHAAGFMKGWNASPANRCMR